MAFTKFRTLQDLEHAQRQEKYSKVVQGKPYEGDPAFPIHEYLNNKLLGKDVRMLELNAGAALVNQLVVDTITTLKIEDDDLQEWAQDIELSEILEEAAADMYGNGFFVGQYVKDDDDTAITINPAHWFPDLPALTHMPVTSGRVMIPLVEYDDQGRPMYFVYVEKHEEAKYTRELYKLNAPNDVQGNPVKLSAIDRFAELDDTVQTGDFTILHKNRKKTSRSFFSSSVLDIVWQQLQEINEIKTQLRQERIKHFKGKLAAPVESLMRSTTTVKPEDARHSKEAAAIEQQRVYNMSQEVFPIPVGGQIPQYIQRDLESITKGIEMIDKCLSEICATTGFPRSIFNLDEKGQIHVTTEEKKDARYMRHVLRGQQKIISFVRFLCEKKKPGFTGTITLANPFDLTKEQTIELLRKQNPDAAFVSQRRAIELIHDDMDEQEREVMIQQINDEGIADGFTAPAVDLNQ